VQQQEPGVAWCDIGGHKQVVEPVHCLRCTEVEGQAQGTATAVSWLRVRLCEVCKDPIKQ
jgi:hypothetical protein